MDLNGWKLNTFCALGAVGFLALFSSLRQPAPTASQDIETKREIYTADLTRQPLISGAQTPGIQVHQPPQGADVAKAVFRKTSSGFEAGPVSISANGALLFKGTQDRETISQTFVAADLVKAGTKQETLERRLSEPKLYNEPNEARVLFPSYTRGVDLEYRFDGANVEEFFHLSENLKSKITQENKDLRIKTLLPGLSTASGALVVPFGEGPDRWGKPGPDGKVLSPESAFSHTGDIELTVRRDVFKLPKAVAYDEANSEKILARHFEWVPEGLLVTTELPHDWVRYSTGRVSIDPSVVFGQGFVSANTTNEKNIVRDSEGNLHLAFYGTYGGWYQVLHTYSDDNGASWKDVRPIWPKRENEGASRIVTRYWAPTIVIDSADRVHAVWQDYGYISGLNTGRENARTVNGHNYEYDGWGHLAYYASSEKDCWKYRGDWDNASQALRDACVVHGESGETDRDWTEYNSRFFKNPWSSHGLLVGTEDTSTYYSHTGVNAKPGNRYQHYFSIAADTEGAVFLSWVEDGWAERHNRFAKIPTPATAVWGTLAFLNTDQTTTFSISTNQNPIRGPRFW